MGVDVVYGVRTAERLNDEQFTAAREAFFAAFPDDHEPHRWPTFDRDLEDPNAIEIDCLDRYYGTSYSRGHWPTIRAMGDWLMLRFGEEAEVRYGGDTSHGWGELLPYPPQRQDNDEHWSTRGHYPYRESCGCDHCSSLPRSRRD